MQITKLHFIEKTLHEQPTEAIYTEVQQLHCRSETDFFHGRHELRGL